MDTIAALSPDLVVAGTDLPPAAVKQLRKVAPVVEVRSANAADPIGQMNKNLDLLAQATGTTEQAEKLKKDFDANVAEGKKALADAGLDGAKYAFADGYDISNQVSIRPFTSGSLIGAVNEKLGLKNDWTVKGDESYGLGTTDVEGLTKLSDDVRFAYAAWASGTSTRRSSSSAPWPTNWPPFARPTTPSCWRFGSTPELSWSPWATTARPRSDSPIFTSSCCPCPGSSAARN
jgi:ABC-type Fe3+-hydroxamate transport system substrate-binding protein